MRVPAFLFILFFALPAAGQQRSELAELLAADDAAFPKALQPREFGFPADHGPHPAFRNEWWYVTGNLDSERGRRFGFELTVFRFALAPTQPDSPSAWRSNQVYIAHLALTDPEGEQFLAGEKFSRGAVGLAGARAAPFAVWIDDWRIAERNDSSASRPAGVAWRLEAGTDEFELALDLNAVKPPVLNGDRGLSRKSDEPGNASYYYSMTRLATAGEIRLGNEGFAVTGLSWLDREWSSSALAADQIGWDWFALQLDDGRDLMFYSLRLADGSQDSNSAGTLTAADGSAVKLGRDAVDLTVLDTWDSPAGGTYPSRWRLAIPSQALDLEITPILADQELFTTVRYWEGAVDVKGHAAGGPIEGRGYVELTGYAPAANPD